MSLSGAQNTFYWRLWGQLRKAQPDADRHTVHRHLGLPESHKEWDNADFDHWKRHVLAIAQPGNYRAQVRQLKMPAIRQRVFIGYLLEALERPESYAEAILQRMNLAGAEGSAMLTLDTAQDSTERMPEGLDTKGQRQWKREHPTPLADVMVALKKECRREWATKEDLLEAIHAVGRHLTVPKTVMRDAVQTALCWPSLPDLEKMYYEPLLVVLAVLRRLAAGRPGVAEHAAEEEAAEIDIPF